MGGAARGAPVRLRLRFGRSAGCGKIREKLQRLAEAAARWSLLRPDPESHADVYAIRCAFYQLLLAALMLVAMLQLLYLYHAAVRAAWARGARPIFRVLSPVPAVSGPSQGAAPHRAGLREASWMPAATPRLQGPTKDHHGPQRCDPGHSRQCGQPAAPVGPVGALGGPSVGVGVRRHQGKSAAGHSADLCAEQPLPR